MPHKTYPTGTDRISEIRIYFHEDMLTAHFIYPEMSREDAGLRVLYDTHESPSRSIIIMDRSGKRLMLGTDEFFTMFVQMTDTDGEQRALRIPGTYQ